MVTVLSIIGAIALWFILGVCSLGMMTGLVIILYNGMPDPKGFEAMVVYELKNAPRSETLFFILSGPLFGFIATLVGAIFFLIAMLYPIWLSVRVFATSEEK